MTIKSIKIIVLVLIVLVVSSVILYEIKFAKYEGGDCDSEEFTDKVKVKNIVIINDSINMVYLKSIIDTNNVYQLDSWEYSFVVEKNIDEKEIKDTLKRYTISGNRTTQGTCVPYFIKKMVVDTILKKSESLELK